MTCHNVQTVCMWWILGFNIKVESYVDKET